MKTVKKFCCDHFCNHDFTAESLAEKAKYDANYYISCDSFVKPANRKHVREVLNADIKGFLAFAKTAKQGDVFKMKVTGKYLDGVGVDTITCSYSGHVPMGPKSIYHLTGTVSTYGVINDMYEDVKLPDDVYSKSTNPVTLKRIISKVFRDRNLTDGEPDTMTVHITEINGSKKVELPTQDLVWNVRHMD